MCLGERGGGEGGRGGEKLEVLNFSETSPFSFFFLLLLFWWSYAQPRPLSISSFFSDFICMQICKHREGRELHAEVIHEPEVSPEISAHLDAWKWIRSSILPLGLMGKSLSKEEYCCYFAFNVTFPSVMIRLKPDSNTWRSKRDKIMGLKSV